MNIPGSSALFRLLSLSYRFRSALRQRGRGARQARKQRALFYEKAWREAAAALGGEVEVLFGDVLEVSWGEVRTRVCCNYTTLDDPVTLLLAGDKAAVYALLARQNLPVPRHALFSPERLGPALAFLRQQRGPCVVKPARDTGAGQGVTTGVMRLSHLIRATAAAAAFSSALLIEEEHVGDVYRLLYLDGKLLDAVIRRPPAVYGDGKRTIAALVREANEERLVEGFSASQVLLSPDLEMRRTLARQGFTLRSVPPAGARVVVKTVINENAAWENEAAAHLISGAVAEAGARAALAVGARLAGVDIITRDPARPLEETGGAILEVNTTPGFYYHYHKQNDRCPVALHVLRSLGGASTGEARAVG